jgi:hypothetical protein
MSSLSQILAPINIPSELLDDILSFIIDSESLQKCRLVNYQWKNLALEHLITRINNRQIIYDVILFLNNTSLLNVLALGSGWESVIRRVYNERMEGLVERAEELKNEYNQKLNLGQGIDIRIIQLNRKIQLLRDKTVFMLCRF